MANNVLNFSLRLLEDKPVVFPPQLRVGIVPISLDAFDAAVIAETNQYEVLIVVQDGVPRGLFFRHHLARLLPGHFLVLSSLSEPVLPGTPVSEIIRRLDLAAVAFHSESVNEYLWVCPKGHVTEGNPCPDHGLPTTEY